MLSTKNITLMTNKPSYLQLVTGNVTPDELKQLKGIKTTLVEVPNGFNSPTNSKQEKRK